MDLLYFFAMAVIACLANAYDPADSIPTEFECTKMSPFNMHNPQIMPSPFEIKFQGHGYYPGEEVKVNLTAPKGRPFRAFIIQARQLSKYSNINKYAGAFINLDEEAVKTATDCQGQALRSVDSEPKELVRLVWKSPNYYAGHFEFRVTFVEDERTFWLFEKSKKVYDIKNTPPHLLLDIITPRLIEPIHTDDCGGSKGCYREPEDCQELDCLFIVTWRQTDYRDLDGHLNPAIEFEMGAMTDGLDDRYVALGLSDDKYMGDDLVMACVHVSSKNGSVEVFQSFNTPDKHNSPLPGGGNKSGIRDEEGSYYNGRLRCRFKKEKASTGPKNLFSLSGQSYHLLVARGGASKGHLYKHGLSVGEFPQVSPNKIEFQRPTNEDGHARYHLVKAHGCLMIIAWIFFATIGLILTKFYKRMWPNSRIFGLRYWFVGHFNCMAMCFLMVLISFILIVVEAEGYTGYSETRELPQRAHPILGIIIFICVIINPIIALIRPDEESWWRPVFNWIHFIFGFVANILSIPNIFIGLDFGKANVPWWATWILVIYVIFHLIVELSLEIHGCCMYKKDKKRMQKYEMQKRESSKFIPEPEPAGRRFKQNMLVAHFIVTTIITIIMVIIIAAC